MSPRVHRKPGCHHSGELHTSRHTDGVRWYPVRSGHGAPGSVREESIHDPIPSPGRHGPDRNGGPGGHRHPRSHSLRRSGHRPAGSRRPPAVGHPGRGPVVGGPAHPARIRSQRTGVGRAVAQLHRQHRPGPVRRQRGPGRCSHRPHLSRGARRCLRHPGRQRRARPAGAAHPGRRVPGREPHHLRGDQPGGPAAGHPADQRCRCRAVRHRGTAGHAGQPRLRRRELRPGPGPPGTGGGRGQGHRPGDRRHRLAAGPAVHRRRLVLLQPAHRHLRREPRHPERPGHQLHRPGGPGPGGRRCPRLRPVGRRPVLLHRGPGRRRRVVLLPQQRRLPRHHRPRLDRAGHPGPGGPGPVAVQRHLHQGDGQPGVGPDLVPTDVGNRRRRAVLPPRAGSGRPDGDLPGGAGPGRAGLPVRTVGPGVPPGGLRRRRVHLRWRRLLRLPGWQGAE